MVFVILNPIIVAIDTFSMEDILNFDKAYTYQETFSQSDGILSLYSKAIESEIKGEFSNINSVTVIFSDDLEKIEKIEIVLQDNSENIKEIKDYLLENYGISGNIIWVIR